ncbi:hypothetical protein HDE_11141 [Halotydeus destructor]|nr:hypothetical protein HDE_11141 [Halotydeus destructor]
MIFKCKLTQVLPFVAIACQFSAAIDLTTVAHSSGRDVVQATLSKIERSKIFPDDKRYLRRLAYVATQDGASLSTYSDQGGIWRIDESRLLSTQDTSRPDIKIYHDEIRRQFQIIWPNIKMADLNEPLISALAAQLSIAVLQVTIPADLLGQAKYWAAHNGQGPADRFLVEVYQLEIAEPKLEGITDMGGVLDSTVTTGKVLESERRFYEYKYNQFGMTVNLSISTGNVRAYYSYTIPQPSAVINDGMINGVTYMAALSNRLKENGVINLFVTIEGQTATSTYTLTTKSGNHRNTTKVEPYIYVDLLSPLGIIILLFLLYRCRRLRLKDLKSCDGFFRALYKLVCCCCCDCDADEDVD